ncbi:carbon-nitrogen hydrolase family protein [Microvirga soli]|uniref:carbon-nitrogen hydrolase family protein n=1 Tax=Microvirga soli TaxID=1854496 RepID=UPI00191E1800|nr:carbon-nitrogen hydrolase family protein [Microvirga soli]
MSELKIALAQTLVTPDVEANASRMRELMHRAKAEGADLIHFTEGALSGYGRKEIVPFECWTTADWNRLHAKSQDIAALAGELGLWTVFGSVHRLDDGQPPHNCLYVIGSDGKLITRYNKRLCSHSEINGLYTPGFDPVVFTVNGVCFGCVICIEIRFPEIFEQYQELGVQCLLFSTFTAGRYSDQDARQDAIFGITAQAHAANNSYWISMVTPANPVQGSSTQFIDPLGNVVVLATRHNNEIVIGRISLEAGSAWAATERARIGREEARRGDIYRSRASKSARSFARDAF